MPDVGAKHVLQIGSIAILHTFNGKLEFNSHIHTIVTTGGLSRDGVWINSVYVKRDDFVRSWRGTVILLLKRALAAGLLRNSMSIDQVIALLAEKERVWWRVKIQNFKSKSQFLQYAGRYVRRPPIA
jgi:hypothetical protein